MKKLTKVLAILLSVLMVVSVISFTANAEASGKCGDNAFWNFESETGTLYLTGEGEMYDYDYYTNDAPWGIYREQINSVIISNKIESIGKAAFYKCDKITKIEIPQSVTCIGNEAFYDCFGITEISIPNSVIKIGEYAFLDCKRITNLVIPDSVNYIGGHAFQGCYALSFLSIGNGVTDISDFAFYYCVNLQSVILGNNIERIGIYAFNYCIELDSIKLPESITNIDSCAFGRCAELLSVYIPDKVNSINDNSFSDCGKLSIHCIKNSYAEKYAKKLNVAVTYHEYISKVIIPTCTESGYTEYTCPVCGDKYVDDSSIVPASHKWNSPIVISEPTCTTNGNGYKICSVCSQGESYIIPATGHNYEIEEKAATHTEDGYIKKVCSVCGDTITVILHAEGHTFTEWNVAVNPACAKDGLRVRQCVICDYTEKESIPAIAHSFGEWEVIEEATDSKAGLKQRNCANCTEIEQEEIPMIEYPNPFDDVPADTWYTKAALWCNAKGYFTGVGAATFSPNTKLTRAQFVQILAKVSEDSFDEIEYTAKFTDVPEGKWFTKAVMWCVKNGITGGTSATTFSPNGEVTREQLATFFLAYAKSRGYDISASASLGKYTDAGNISSWAKTAMQWAIAEGLISGTGATALSPKTSATRAQAAVIFKNFVERYVAKQK